MDEVGIPFALQIEITSRCNLRCKMCPLTTGDTASHIQPGHMAEMVWSEVLSVARQSKQVFVSGFGEPLMNPDCLPLLAELDAEGIKMTIATNGIGITPSVAKQLSDLEHLQHINVSIDSPDTGLYRQVRGGSLNRAMRGLRALMETIDDPLRVSVSSVAMHDTIESLVQFPPLLAELGVRHYILQGVFDYNAHCEGQGLLRRPAFTDAVERLRAACDEHGIELVLTMPERSGAEMTDPQRAFEQFFRRPEPSSHETRQCLLPWEVPYVDKDGRVYSCCYAASTETEPLGRLATETLAAVWSGTAYRDFRRNLLDGATMPAVCRSCTAVSLGEHPLRQYRASLVPESLTISDGRVSVGFRNDGAKQWAAEDEVRIGTASPRDGSSPLFHHTWLSGNRPATFTGEVVRPGETATFVFELGTDGSADGPWCQPFELVVDGVCWLPGTRFIVDPRPAVAASK